MSELDVVSVPKTAGEPAASVVIPSYRGAARLPALLDSLAAQQEGTPDFEVIVVIDGVDDGSVGLVDREDRIDVRAIVFPQNRGRVAALNAGFEAARGRVLIRCDDDLEPGPGFVSRHVEAHRDRPRGVIGLYLNVYEPTPYAVAYGKCADARHRADAYATIAELRWRYWAGNCSITRETWERVGPYDPEFRLYGWEDIDYGYRLHAAGIEVRLDPALETPHRVAAVTTAVRAQRAVHAAAARRIFEGKHPDSGLPPALPGRSIWNTAVRAVSPVTGRYPRQAGSAVDRVLPLLPIGVGRKLVALTVESAALAGYLDPGTAKEVF
ncbi:glycosyltransferase [Brachybacterium muris]|uniref:glycosyltransferase family 2 protein n=1 Tax=Brachybacterium muris TaxID=219301 RepID=UPI00223A91E0|nr:glycosyltransferase family 2 protein [Brachybacterium muris]MCT1429675.1 glycosyltransferase [Brachybacterium muris]MCT2176821.1 glycosyltransferase [Brachybacterium muris]MCT2261783.1 glycosyltransferase [Brachybacterium muris]